MRDITDRVISTTQSDCAQDAVKWAPVKSLWWNGMTLGWLVGGTIFFSWGAVLAFLVLCIVTLCGGHSLGMHRKLIHDSFDCPKWLERLGVYLGTLVGLGGPFTMMKTHDMRDWAQRQPQCHSYLCHDNPMLKDFWWQVHCTLTLRNPPGFRFPVKLTQDPFMRFLQRTAMLQQLPLAAILFLIGGWGFVFWGVCGRVSLSIFGHWFVGYFAHNTGHKDWINEGAAVQGHNVRFCGLITFGESWHNNHHAFPESARLGLYNGQPDPGWWVLLALGRLGLVRNPVLPDDITPRKDLKRAA